MGIVDPTVYMVIINDPADAEPFERCIIIGVDAWVSLNGDRFRTVSNLGDFSG